MPINSPINALASPCLIRIFICSHIPKQSTVRVLLGKIALAAVSGVVLLPSSSCPPVVLLAVLANPVSSCLPTVLWLRLRAVSSFCPVLWPRCLVPLLPKVWVCVSSLATQLAVPFCSGLALPNACPGLCVLLGSRFPFFHRLARVCFRVLYMRQKCSV